MFNKIWAWILNNIFHVKTETRLKEIEDNQKYAYDYKRIDNINFNAIFSNKLANYVITDSTMDIEGKNERTDLLNKIGQSMWKKGKKIISMTLGYGGLILVPYTKNGKLYYNLVSQDRMTIDATDGDDIIEATVLAEKKEITTAIGDTKEYLRWTHYKVVNGNCVIEQKFSDGSGKQIPTPDFWKNIPLSITISGVDRVLFGYIKSPINNRKNDDKYGVPITYGCEDTINEIKETMKQIAREFKLKEAFVGADVTMFKGKDALPINGLYKKVDAGEDSFWEVFDPAFRDNSYMNRLNELYIRLEHQIGTSAGIISQVQTTNATATEVKRAMYDTFTIVDDMRSNVEKGLEDFFYACNVLANAYNLSAQGDYEVSFDWSYSLIEDSQETFSQLIQGHNLDIIGKEELRQWIYPDETIEEAKTKIEEIQANLPNIENIINEDEEK